MMSEMRSGHGPEQTPQAPNEENKQAAHTETQSVPDHEDFSTHDLEHDLVLRYEPAYLGEGASQVAYEVKGHPDVVCKVNFRDLGNYITQRLRTEQNPAELDPVGESLAKEQIAREKRRHSQLRQYFGKEHVPKQRQMLMKVPVNKRLLQHILRTEEVPDMQEAWTIVAIQDKAQEINNPAREALSSGYSEFHEPDPETYRAVTDHLIFGKNPDQKITPEELLATQNNTHMARLVRDAQGNLELQESLKDALSKCIQYTTETGEILDLAGLDNAFLHPTEDGWSYKMIDALYGNDQLIDKSRQAITKLLADIPVTDYEVNYLLNTFNYIRTVNGLAELFGVDGRINLGFNGAHEELQDVDFLEMLKNQ